MRDTILGLADQRQEVLLLTAFYILRGRSEAGCPLDVERKELKQIEKD